MLSDGFENFDSEKIIIERVSNGYVLIGEKDGAQKRVVCLGMLDMMEVLRASFPEDNSAIAVVDFRTEFDDVVEDSGLGSLS